MQLQDYRELVTGSGNCFCFESNRSQSMCRSLQNTALFSTVAASLCRGVLLYCWRLSLCTAIAKSTAIERRDYNSIIECRVNCSRLTP